MVWFLRRVPVRQYRDGVDERSFGHLFVYFHLLFSFSHRTHFEHGLFDLAF